MNVKDTHIKDFAEHLIKTRGPMTSRMIAVVFLEGQGRSVRDADPFAAIHEELLADDRLEHNTESGFFSLKEPEAEA